MNSLQLPSQPEELTVEYNAVMPDNMRTQNNDDPQCFTLDSQRTSSKSTQGSKEPFPKIISLEGQHPSAQKGAVHTKPQNLTAGNVRLQKSSLKSKRVTHMEPPLKITQSFESVRSKMRESLAASLALVCHEQSDGRDGRRETQAEVAITKQSGAYASTQSCQTTSETIITPLHHALECSETSKEHKVEKINGVINVSTLPFADTKEHTGKCQVQKCDVEHGSQQRNVPVDVSFSDGILLKDELLLENGLCWSSCLDAEKCEAEENCGSMGLKLVCDVLDEPVTVSETPESLAIKIEQELFKLFGGVNKKYKEKGRSLLFNLRDQHNPELRKRVFSGEIAPEHLCSMSAEELASKELSEWRIAKAEELAQMVVLPDSEVDLRWLVKKTHKGEIHVEVEQDDNVSVEVTISGNSLLQNRNSKEDSEFKCRPSSKDGLLQPKPNETRMSAILDSPDNSDSEKNVMTSLMHDNTDFMQDLMVEEFAGVESLPPVPTLDEFMRELDSQPPFENLPVHVVEESVISDEKDSDSPDTKLVVEMENLVSELGSAEKTSETKLVHELQRPQRKPDDRPVNKVVQNNVNSAKIDVQRAGTFIDSKHNSPCIMSDIHSARYVHKSEHVWDGLIQLNISSVVTVLGFHKSGEWTSIKDWPSFLEIKGRVRLDAFAKFLQELSLSRSRGIMVLQFVWKQGSPESGLMKLRETVDSYVADERVGFAEPMPGAELYFCPPHPKISQMLLKNLPTENGEIITSVDNGLVGVVVWRKATATSTLSKTLNTNSKYTSKEQPVSGKNLISESRSTSNSFASTPSCDDEPFDDAPPGFGPAASTGDNDLPEFDFVQSSAQIEPSNFGSSNGPVPSFPRPPPPARSVEQMRQLIQKYGQNDNRSDDLEMDIEPWNDDDDIPERHPNKRNKHHQTQRPQSYHHRMTQPHLLGDDDVQHPMLSRANSIAHPGWRSGHWQNPVQAPRHQHGWPSHHQRTWGGRTGWRPRG